MPMYYITREEAGQKCITFIQRKYSVAPIFIHKLIRKGAVRINGKRCKPFTRVLEGDGIFLPASLSSSQDCEVQKRYKMYSLCEADRQLLYNATLYEDDELLILNKPQGIPVHNGSYHNISIATLIHALYKESTFAPTLVHRLDKDTTGILLIAKTYTMLQKLHATWKEVQKYYLAWVHGIWEYDTPLTLKNNIEKVDKKMVVTQGDDVALTALCLQRAKKSSLLLIQLHTGKTHQIRTQLSSRNHCIIGDSKYSNNAKKFPLHLHAVALYIDDSRSFYCLPTHWYSNFALSKNLINKIGNCKVLLS